MCAVIYNIVLVKQNDENKLGKERFISSYNSES